MNDEVFENGSRRMNMKRVLSLLLCAILILALFPAAAFARYSTVSNRGVELQYPSERDYYLL